MAPKPAKKAVTKLRSLPTTPRIFWKGSMTEQLSQTMLDETPEYYTRALTPNEITCMAFNEIAAAHKRAFFYHLPTRPTLSGASPSEARLPPERKTVQPSEEYPEMVVMDHAWDDETRDLFLAEAARTRYLRSNGMMSLPPSWTPLYSLQCIPTFNGQIFITAPASLVLLATESRYYLLPSTTLENITGRHPRQKGRIGTPKFLWDRSLLHTGSESVVRQRRQQDAALNKYAADSLEAVYHAICARCCGSRRSMHTSMTAETLERLIPRPDPLQAGSVGQALGGGGSADSRSRRLEHRDRGRKRKRVVDDVDGMETGQEEGSVSSDEWEEET